MKQTGDDRAVPARGDGTLLVYGQWVATYARVNAIRLCNLLYLHHVTPLNCVSPTLVSDVFVAVAASHGVEDVFGLLVAPELRHDI